MAAMNNVKALHLELLDAWNKPQLNIKKCGNLLDKLKIELTKLVFLPTKDSTPTIEELILARDVLEIAVEYSVCAKDIPAFERYMAQLKCYYFDYTDEIGQSINKYKLLGLNLLFLLSQNRVSEFHTELELLPQKRIQTDEFIRHPLSLEQYLMEGSYNKIFSAKRKGPLPPSYNVFMDTLLDTVRDEIGKCLESSYERISTGEAARRLNFKTEKQVIVFGQKNNWELEAEGYYDFASKKTKPREPLPSIELAEQAISYARELEMIV